MLHASMYHRIIRAESVATKHHPCAVARQYPHGGSTILENFEDGDQRATVLSVLSVLVVVSTSQASLGKPERRRVSMYVPDESSNGRAIGCKGGIPQAQYIIMPLNYLLC